MKVGRQDEKEAKGQTPPTALLFVFSISHSLCLILNSPFLLLTLEHSQNKIPKIPLAVTVNVTKPCLLLMSAGLFKTVCLSRLKVSVSDEDAGLISTDTKDLNVSRKISHCDNCGGAERDVEREDGTESRG